LNIDNPLNTFFYIETRMRIENFAGCNSSPRLAVPPIDKACTSAAWFHNPGAYDPDPGDSLSYELVVPKRGKGSVVFNYRDPDSQEFYSRVGINYNQANEAGTGRPDFTINPQTGTIKWDAPGAPGEYNIAFIVNEWKKIAGSWVKVGFVTRDMQIIVEDCRNQRPILQLPADLCITAGERVSEDIFGWDPDGHDVKIEAFSPVFSINPNPAAIDPTPATFQPSGPAAKARVRFTWDTDCLHVASQPYQVVFKITDRPTQGPPLVYFETWNIRVVAPAPVWQTATVDYATRSVNLQWQDYTCANALSMQVWRKVDSAPFTPPTCVTGMPEFLGYSKLAEVPMATTQWRDNNEGVGVAPGARYCYRLVAVFPLPDGSESYVSQEICTEPILADAPVITHVTIDRTDAAQGQVTVRWRPPFEADPTQFPPPYTYEVYRAQGFAGRTQLQRAHAGRLADTVLVDGGINTLETVYNYRIIAFDANNVRIDTSAVASTVRLEAAPREAQVDLLWSARVPWSNQATNFPEHLIFRGLANTPQDQFELIAQVDVRAEGFRYQDRGTFQGRPLQKSETYCYRVQTRGAYGNPRINEPLENFSQVICTRLDDNEPPCTPTINVTQVPCEELRSSGCATAVYTNTLKWNRPDDAACRADIRGYRVYVAATAGGDYTLLADMVSDTVYVDRNLPSYARCYRVTAVDHTGNESARSEEFCFDNCPYYELPNVFTPNGDLCNEVFSAYGDPEASASCGATIDPMRCARFVKDVDFVVYNRWGREVYRLPESKEKSIYIRWNGKDNDGSDLPAGMYYYKANVYFDTADPARAHQLMKGWVHLMRTTHPTN
jgi:hypothetical protein